MIPDIERFIRPGTSQCMINHICFTDHHHYGHLSSEETIAKYRGTVLGEFLDFDLIEAPPKEEPKPEPRQAILHLYPTIRIELI